MQEVKSISIYSENKNTKKNTEVEKIHSHAESYCIAVQSLHEDECEFHPPACLARLLEAYG